MRKFINADKKGSSNNRLNTITNNSNSLSKGSKYNFDIDNNSGRDLSGFLNTKTFNSSTQNIKSENDNKFIDLKDFEDKMNRYNEIDSSLKYMHTGNFISFKNFLNSNFYFYEISSLYFDN